MRAADLGSEQIPWIESAYHEVGYGADGERAKLALVEVLLRVAVAENSVAEAALVIEGLGEHATYQLAAHAFSRSTNVAEAARQVAEILAKDSLSLAHLTRSILAEASADFREPEFFETGPERRVEQAASALMAVGPRAVSEVTAYMLAIQPLREDRKRPVRGQTAWDVGIRLLRTSEPSAGIIVLETAGRGARSSFREYRLRERDPNPIDRAASILSEGGFTIPPDLMVRTLESTTADVGNVVVQKSVVALELGRVRHPSGLELLVETLADPNPVIAEAAARGLALLGDSRAIPALLRHHQAALTPRRDQPPMATATLRALIALGDGRAVSPLRDDLRNWDSSTRAATLLEDAGWEPPPSEAPYFDVALDRGFGSRLRYTDSDIAAAREMLLDDARTRIGPARTAAVFTIVALGDSLAVPSLISVLRESGDRELATGYLNSGHDGLRQAGIDWAQSNGYAITSDWRSSNGPRWRGR